MLLPDREETRASLCAGDATIYLYDGNDLIAEADSSGTALAAYTHASEIDEPLASRRSGATSYYEQDGQNSITSLTNPTGTIAGTYVYDAFGGMSVSTGMLTNPVRYTGREFDVETGFYHYRERSYDATIGRFLSEDLLRFKVGSNFYAYVFNEPTDYIDPSGLTPKPPCCKPEVSKLQENLRVDEWVLQSYEFTGGVDMDQFQKYFPNGGPGGNTTCDLTTMRGHPEIVFPPQPHTTMFIDPNKSPCLYNCALEHEKVHQKMCIELGAKKYNALSEAAKEMPAYRVGIKCIRRALRRLGL